MFLPSVLGRTAFHGFCNELWTGLTLELLNELFSFQPVNPLFHGCLTLSGSLRFDLFNFHTPLLPATYLFNGGNCHFQNEKMCVLPSTALPNANEGFLSNVAWVRQQSIGLWLPATVNFQFSAIFTPRSFSFFCGAEKLSR